MKSMRWVALASLLVGCGPPAGSEVPGSGSVVLGCGESASLGGMSDTGWSEETVLEPLALDCRWEGMEFEMYRRVSDGALFHRPLFKVVEYPEVDEFVDGSGRTLAVRMMVAVPDMEAACRWPDGEEGSFSLAEAEPLPLETLKLRIDAPVESTVCEMHDAHLMDEEVLRLEFPDRGSARKVEEALNEDPTRLRLRAWYAIPGKVREIRCDVDGDALSSVSYRHTMASRLRDAGFVVDGDAVMYVTPDARASVVEAVARVIAPAIVDAGSMECPDGMDLPAAEAVVQSWVMATHAPGDAAWKTAFGLSNAREEGVAAQVQACRDAIVTALGPDADMSLDDGGLWVRWDEVAQKVQGAALEACEGDAEVIQLQIMDVEAGMLRDAAAAQSPAEAFHAEILSAGGGCARTCGEGCCDEREDCTAVADMDEMRCGTGVEGARCVVCPSDTICDATCVTPPWQDHTYDVVFVSVRATSCGGMEVGACDVDVEWKTPDEADWNLKIGPKNGGGVELEMPVYLAAPPGTVTKGFDVSLNERDPFADDFLGSCHVDVGKEHMVAAFRKKGAPESTQTCSKSSNVVTFKVTIAD